MSELLELSIHERTLLHFKSQSDSKDFSFLTTQLLENKSNNQYPYWLFDSFACESNDVKLEKMELSLCKAIGPKRTLASRAAGLKNMLKDDPKNEEFNEINGIAGELAYAKRYNLYPIEQFEVRPRKSALDNGDFTHNGLCIDVKATKYPTGRLTLSSWKHAEKVDIFCLITGNYLSDNVYKIRGFMTSKDITLPSRYGVLRDNARGKQFIANQHELYSLEEAIEKINQTCVA